MLTKKRACMRQSRRQRGYQRSTRGGVFLIGDEKKAPRTSKKSQKPLCTEDPASKHMKRKLTGKLPSPAKLPGTIGRNLGFMAFQKK